MIVYNIPVDLIAAYRGRRVIVRTDDATELVKALPDSDVDNNLIAVRLIGLSSDIEPLTSWGRSVPVDLVMLDPQKEFPLLFKHARLLDSHPLRVCISTVPGFSLAVRVAAALRLMVKLELRQPNREVLDEMAEVIDFYLNHASAAQPIEFFHSTLLDFYHGNSASLWEIQEEDPAHIRYVTEDGRETVDRRPFGSAPPGDLTDFVFRLQKQLLTAHAECLECEFFEHCGGYFKWPSKDYPCAGIKTLFRSLKDGAAGMKSHVAIYSHADVVGRAMNQREDVQSNRV